MLYRKYIYVVHPGNSFRAFLIKIFLISFPHEGNKENLLPFSVSIFFRFRLRPFTYDPFKTRFSVLDAEAEEPTTNKAQIEAFLIG